MDIQGRIPVGIAGLNQPPSRNDKQPLNEREVQQVFDLLEDDFRPLWNNPSRDCESRAHLFDTLLAYLEPWKLWAFQEKPKSWIPIPVQSDPDDVNRENWPDGWRYHVALTVPVQTEGGDIVETVLDPGLFDGPVSAGQWAKTLGVKPQQIVHAPANESPAKAYEGTPLKVLDALHARYWDHRDESAKKADARQSTSPTFRYQRLEAPSLSEK